MKQVFLTLILLYRNYISLAIRMLFGISQSCRFKKSCSTYAYESIAEFGVVRGGAKAVRRVVQCQPFL